MDFKQELIKSIQTVVDRELDSFKCDRKYKTMIKEVTDKGYVVLDRTGSERTVKCCILGLELQARQLVWVKEPLGDLKGLHICGVA